MGAAILAPLLLTALVYHPIVRNYFFGDDFLNFFAIANDGVVEYLLKPNGGHILLTRNAVFYSMRQLFGVDPGPFFSVVLVTHLVNVWLLFRVIRGATSRVFLASFGAAIWGATPFNEGTLGWYSVYGHVLVAGALLVILDQALSFSTRRVWPTRGRRVFWWLLAMAAATSFGTGVAVALILPFTLFLLLRDNRPEPLRRTPLLSLLLAVPLLYLALIWSYELISGDNVHSDGTYSGLSCDWVSNGLFCLRLIALGLTRLLLGFYAPSGEMPGLSYGLLAVLGILCVWAGWRSRQIRSRLVAVALLIVGSYAIVALARACVFFDVSTDVLSLFSRYHYVGQLMLTILACLALDAFDWTFLSRGTTLILAGWYVAAVFGYVFFAKPIDHFDEVRQGTNQVVATMGSMIRSVPPGETVRIENRKFLPMQFLPGGWAGAFIIFFPENVVDGRRVLFVEHRPAAVAKLRKGNRMRSLIVGEGDL